MNYKSEILKFSIIFMIILVLIPVATAMDSNDTFYEEYDCSDNEDVIAEYDNCEVEDTQEDLSSDSHNSEDFQENNIEENSDYDSEIETDGEEDEIKSVIEFNNYSADVTHEVIDSSQSSGNQIELTTDFEQISYDINESSDEELTIEEISVEIKCSFISKFNIESKNSLDDILHCGNGNFSKNYHRYLFKVIELKNHLLMSNFTPLDDIITDNADGQLIVSINKITTDFIYSIDNAIIKDGYSVFLSGFCFLNFSTYYFDAAFSCELYINYFFSCDNAVTFENFSSELLNISENLTCYQGLFDRIQK